MGAYQIIDYQCSECGGIAVAVDKHVRVEHAPDCARWADIIARYPFLAA